MTVLFERPHSLPNRQRPFVTNIVEKISCLPDVPACFTDFEPRDLAVSVVTAMGLRVGAERASGTHYAAHALSLGATLVTNNAREFRRVPDLRVENWVTPAA